nr:MAG TPA: hypothetical protein [Caudoviricetes sp.]DAO66298.1 MAG TPA: hypothetical protein [Caudoviricetes sp.]
MNTVKQHKKPKNLMQPLRRSVRLIKRLLKLQI